MTVSLSSKLFASAKNGSFWAVFNTLQIIQLISLIDLSYSERLEQFYHGFEFALIRMELSFDLLQDLTDYSSRDEPFSSRIWIFGFESAFFLVLQLLFFVTLILVAIIALCSKSYLKCCAEDNRTNKGCLA